VPRDLAADLRPYQKEGVRWLQFLSDYGVGGILADDMGLGKTLQTLAFLAAERERGQNPDDDRRPTLVIAPTSVLPVWQREAERFLPGLRLYVHHGKERLDGPEAAAGHDVIVTSYDLFKRHVSLFRPIKWHAVVLDEAQAVKNPETKAHRAVRTLEARVRLSLTGTPIENHLGELWAHFDFVLPGLLGSHEEFKRRFQTPIEREADVERHALLQKRIRPFVLRRMKKQVAAELPDRTEIPQLIDLYGEQRDLYETIRVAMDKRVRDALRAHGLKRSAVTVLDALLKLRQVCCHPALLPGDLHRGVATSAKLDALTAMIEELVAEGRRVLVFSQFTTMLARIEAELDARAIEYLLLTGKTRRRGELVERFQQGSVPVFLISLKAGGTGLTLTAADTVIHYDPWWNPAVEQQATDRTHRIGQTMPITVYRLICAGTVEEKIMQLQAKKGDLAASLLEGRGGLAGFTADDVKSLFA
jgi:SNF2 family DNA or RNA helicase